MNLNPILLKIYTNDELHTIFDIPIRTLREFRKENYYYPRPYNLKRTQEELDLNLKYNLIHSTPKLLSPSGSIHFLAYLASTTMTKLPWGTQYPYQQYTRSRKYRLFKIKADPYNLKYLELLNLHIHHDRYDQFYVTHYHNLTILKTALLPLQLVKELLESRDIDHLKQALLRNSKQIKDSFQTTPKAKSFIPLPERSLDKDQLTLYLD